MLLCVLNLSEGRRVGVLERLVGEAGDDVLDLHRDPDHNRAVLTLVGEEAPRAVTRTAVAALDLSTHEGVHPRIGVVDVVPFVPVADTPLEVAVAARDRYAAWASKELDLPCFLYGPLPGRGERTLPTIRREAFSSLAPDVGPPAPHPTAGAVAVGARSPLVAYNIWLAEPDLDLARRIARDLRGEAVRALGLPVGDRAQVSMNLLDPARLGPAEVWDSVSEQAPVERAELVGLVPAAVLARTPRARWEELDLAESKTIEACLAGWRSRP
jgi:glutamate formiminotransferase